MAAADLTQQPPMSNIFTSSNLRRTSVTWPGSELGKLSSAWLLQLADCDGDKVGTQQIHKFCIDYWKLWVTTHQASSSRDRSRRTYGNQGPHVRFEEDLIGKKVEDCRLEQPQMGEGSARTIGRADLKTAVSFWGVAEFLYLARVSLGCGLLSGLNTTSKYYSSTTCSQSRMKHWITNSKSTIEQRIISVVKVCIDYIVPLLSFYHFQIIVHFVIHVNFIINPFYSLIVEQNIVIWVF